MIAQILVSVLLISGALLFLIAAVGILRFPDLYTRMHAATKGSALAAMLMFIGVALFFVDVWVAVEALLVIVFIFLTAPVAGHMIGRAAHTLRTPMAEETVMDELLPQEKKNTSDIAYGEQDADSQ